MNVKAFRGLRGAVLPGLGQVNLLVGGTNSGKTSVLEALTLLADPFDPILWMRVANLRDPSPHAALASSNVDRVTYLFPAGGNEVTSTIALESEGLAPTAQFTATLSHLVGLRPSRPPSDRMEEDIGPEMVEDVERAGVEIAVSASKRPGRQATLFPEPPVAAFQIWEGESVYYRNRRHRPDRTTIRILSPYEHWLRNPVNKEFSEAVLRGGEAETINLLRLIEPRITGARLIEKQREPMLYLQDATAGYLPISSYGDGIRRVLQIALAVQRARHGVLLVDEIETGLHVSMLQRVFDWLRVACVRLDVQLFATTHSLEALDAFLAVDQTSDEDTIAYHLRRGETSTEVTRIGESQLRRLRSTRGLDIR